MRERHPFLSMGFWPTLALLLATLSGPAPPALAATCTVTNTNDAGAGSLRAAIADLNCDPIDFSVTGTINLDSGELSINRSLSITGPGAASLAISGGGVSRVFHITGSSTVVTISGVTIRDGVATYNYGGYFGGGILTFSYSTLTLADSVVTANSAAGGGGGILNGGETLLITNSTVSGNSAGGGAGIYNDRSTLTMNMSTISGNSANSGAGGLMNNRGTVTLTASTVRGNSSALNGGGLANSVGSLTLNASQVLSNSAAQSGGGIYNLAPGTVTLADSTVSGNSVHQGGGGLYNSGTGATIAVSNSTISNNAATPAPLFSNSYGGGVLNSRGHLIIATTTISGNTSDFGGGLYNFGALGNLGTLELTESTVAGNSAVSRGGGIYNHAQGTLSLTNSTLASNSVIDDSTSYPAAYGGGIYNDGILTVLHATLWNNSAISTTGSVTRGGGIYGSGSATLKSALLADNLAAGQSENCGPASVTLTSLGSNLSDDNTCNSVFTDATDRNGVAAELDPAGLKNNGGPTQTVALLASSPAIDYIPSTDCTDVGGNPVTTDQRGVARPQGIDCDIGASEYGQGTTPARTDVSTQPVDGTTGEAAPAIVTFSSVTDPGTTTMVSSSSGAPPPPNFKIGSRGAYYEISTTALYEGPVIVCIDYTGISFSGQPRLSHREDNRWVVLTTISWDPVEEVVCAEASSLSPFALFEPILGIDVEIDIKPGSFPNSINLGSNGTLPVAILSSPEFDASTVDPTTVALSGASVKLRGKGTPMASLEDVNSDGLLDLVVHVSTEALVVSDGDSLAILSGQTYGGELIEGSDTVRIVP